MVGSMFMGCEWLRRVFGACKRLIRLYLSIFPFSLAIFPFLFFVKCVSCGFSLTTMKLTSDDAKDVECAGLK